MRRAPLLAADLAGARPARAEIVADIPRAGQAAEAALEARRQAEERAVRSNTMVWTCSCVQGYEMGLQDD
ncbi:hypothetical protein CMPELA_12590 [Cupriavidus necator]